MRELSDEEADRIVPGIDRGAGSVVERAKAALKAGGADFWKWLGRSVDEAFASRPASGEGDAVGDDVTIPGLRAPSAEAPKKKSSNPALDEDTGEMTRPRRPADARARRRNIVELQHHRSGRDAVDDEAAGPRASAFEGHAADQGAHGHRADVDGAIDDAVEADEGLHRAADQGALPGLGGDADVVGARDAQRGIVGAALRKGVDRAAQAVAVEVGRALVRCRRARCRRSGRRRRRRSQRRPRRPGR